MAKRLPKTDPDYIALMLDQYQSAKTGWSGERQDFREDIKFVSGDPSDQWDDVVKANRDADGVPALTMDRLNPLVSQIVNSARKDRPQPKVTVGDDGIPEVAEAIEGKVRHLLYESHADVAFDTAQMYCAAGGFGFWRVTKEWVKQDLRPSAQMSGYFVQEPRVRRVEDPLTVLFDPEVQELDYSDARYCFVQKKYDRKSFKREFGVDPIDFEFDNVRLADWGDESKVLVAEYWWVEEIHHRLIQFADGIEALADEIGDFYEESVINERDLIERVVHCDLVDGMRKLEECIWEGRWIPIIPEIAREIISDGRKRYASAVRYARDPQIFINASMSSTAQKMATINDAPFIGYKGQFKDKKWSDGKRHFYLESEPVTINGQTAPLPQRNAFEPAIQGSTSATAQGIDALKGAVGYEDSVLRPSQADLSGVAIQRRDAQQSLANLQYEDSGPISMWHGGRVIVDLLMKLADTPRRWKTRKEDGTEGEVPITMDLPEDTNPHAQGMEGQPHLKIDDGDYGVVIDVGPSFATKTEEGTQFLLDLVKADPALIPIYAPAIFKRLGYPDLEEIATAAQPPQIQQALAQNSGKGVPPQILQQQAAQLQQQNQQLKMVLQQVDQMLKTKQIETQGKLDVQNAKTAGDLAIEKLKTIRAMIEAQMEHSHDAAMQHGDHRHQAAKHMLDLFHAAELPHQAAALAPQPAPEGAPTQ